MTAKTIKFPGYPSGLTLTCDVLSPALAALESAIVLTEASGIYSGTITGSHAGQLIFHVKASGSIIDHRVRTIQDTAGPFVILSELDQLANSGRGAHAVTITVTDGTDPLENAWVRLTLGGMSVSAQTDANGEAVFALDSGTYTVTVTKPNYTPEVAALVVSGTTAQQYDLAIIVGDPPSGPGLANGYLLVLDEFGQPEADVVISLNLVFGPNVAGVAHDTAIRTETSDENGLVIFADLTQGARYSIWRNSSTKANFVVPVADTFDLPELIGQE